MTVNLRELRNKKEKSLKWNFNFILYIPCSIVIAYAGTYVIGIGSNYLQDIPGYRSSDKLSALIGYWLIDYAQVILIPLWVLSAFLLPGLLFYKRELEKPIKILMEASERIADNRLDFCIAYPKKNEIGRLCQSFEKMRDSLYRNNQEMWRMLEGHRNLNAAFSHDMRIPLTVLRGYQELLEKYIPDGVISEEKAMDILKKMGAQIDRLEHYTQKMNALQKLEDIIPEKKETDFEQFMKKCRGISDMLSGDLQTAYERKVSPGLKNIRIDEELVLEVYENLISNAARYAKRKLEITVAMIEGAFQISVEDDGAGFTDEALRQAAEPFYRGRKGMEEENGGFHFGAGLYICKIICEKCCGELIIENGVCGGKVTADFGDVLEAGKNF